MKELENHKANMVELHQEVDQQKEYTMVGSLRRVPGLKLWSYNYVTKKVEEVSIKEADTIGLFDKVKEPGKAQHSQHCEYFQALNQKSAEKKSIKLFKDIEH